MYLKNTNAPAPTMTTKHGVLPTTHTTKTTVTHPMTKTHSTMKTTLTCKPIVPQTTTSSGSPSSASDSASASSPPLAACPTGKKAIPTSLTGGNIALLSIAMLFLGIFVLFVILVCSTRCQRLVMRLINRTRGRDKSGSGNDDGSSQTTSHGADDIPLTSITPTTLQRATNLESGSVIDQKQSPFSHTTGPADNAPAVPENDLRWPFWPGVADPPPEPTRAENRVVVEALVEDFAVNTASTTNSVKAASVKASTITVVNIGNSDNNLPAQFRDMMAQKATPTHMDSRLSQQSMVASLGGFSDES